MRLDGQNCTVATFCGQLNEMKRANRLPVTSILLESVRAKRRTFMLIDKAFASKQKLP